MNETEREKCKAEGKRRLAAYLKKHPREKEIKRASPDGWERPLDGK